MSALIDAQGTDADPVTARRTATLAIATIRGLLLDLLAIGDLDACQPSGSRWSGDPLLSFNTGRKIGTIVPIFYFGKPFEKLDVHISTIVPVRRRGPSKQPLSRDY